MKLYQKLILTLLIGAVCWLSCSTTVYAAETQPAIEISEQEELGLVEEGPRVIRMSDIMTGKIGEADWQDIIEYYQYISGQDVVPLHNQGDYPRTPYGDYGTVASHGCGITCLSMVAEYFTNDQESYTPDKLAQQFGDYNTEHGSYWDLFEDSAEELDLPLQKRTYRWEEVMEALRSGQVVISLQREGLFTNGGHFIVLTGLTENGKIMVNDPNGWNYYNGYELMKGFRDGFTEQQIKEDGVVYWLYEKKEVPDIEFVGNLDILGYLINDGLSLSVTNEVGAIDTMQTEY